MAHSVRSGRRGMARLIGLVLAATIVASCGTRSLGERHGTVVSYTVGDMTVYAVADSDQQFEASLFPELDADPAKRALMPGGVSPAVTRTFILQTEGRTILFDAGWGRESAHAGRTRSALAALCISPPEVTDILMTHLDVDHISGLVHNGAAVYPNAHLWISRPEYDARVVRGGERDAKDVERVRRIVSAYGDRVRLMAFGDHPVPGIVAENAVGHTSGHTAWRLTSGEAAMLIVGDFLHAAPLQLRFPALSSVYDVHPRQAAETRQRILARLSTEQTLMAGMHIVSVGHIRADPAGGYVLKPVSGGRAEHAACRR